MKINIFINQVILIIINFFFILSILFYLSVILIYILFIYFLKINLNVIINNTKYKLTINLFKKKKIIIIIKSFLTSQ